MNGFKTLTFNVTSQLSQKKRDLEKTSICPLRSIHTRPPSVFLYVLVFSEN